MDGCRWGVVLKLGDAERQQSHATEFDFAGIDCSSSEKSDAFPGRSDMRYIGKSCLGIIALWETKTKGWKGLLPLPSHNPTMEQLAFVANPGAGDTVPRRSQDLRQLSAQPPTQQSGQRVQPGFVEPCYEVLVFNNRPKVDEVDEMNVKYQFQIHVLGLPTIVTSACLRCSLKGAVSCPWS